MLILRIGKQVPSSVTRRLLLRLRSPFNLAQERLAERLPFERKASLGGQGRISPIQGLRDRSSCGEKSCTNFELEHGFAWDVISRRIGQRQAPVEFGNVITFSTPAAAAVANCRGFAATALQRVDNQVVVRKGRACGRRTGVRRKGKNEVVKSNRCLPSKKSRLPASRPRPKPELASGRGTLSPEQDKNKGGQRNVQGKEASVGTNWRRCLVSNSKVVGIKLVKKLRSLLEQAEWDHVKAEMEMDKLKVRLMPVHVYHVLKHQVDVDKALVFLRWAKGQQGYEHSLDVYYEALRILGDAGSMSAAWQMVDEMSQRHGFVTEGTLMTLVKSYLRLNQVEQALQAFFAMEKYGCRPKLSAWNYMLASLVTGHLQQAFELFQKMMASGCTPNTMTCNLLLDGLARSGQVTAALDLFEQMRQKGYQPDVATYSTLITHLGRSNMVGAAYGVFRNMLAEGCDPNVVVYNSIMDVLGKACEWHLVTAIWKQMAERGCVPDVWSYAILANCFGKAGNMEDAYKVLEEMTIKGRYPNNVVYNTFIANLGKMGKVDAAVQMYEHMKETGRRPCVVTYNTLISIFGKLGRTDEVNELVREMREQDVTPSTKTYNILLDTFGCAGQVDRVLHLFAEMKESDHDPTVVTYTVLLRCLGESGNFAAALEVLREMVRSGCVPDDVLLNVLGKCLEKNGKWHASRLLSSLVGSEGPAEAFRRLLQLLSPNAAGDKAQVLE